MKSFIVLENLVFFANHGVFQQETIVGNEFRVDLKIEMDLEKAAESDDLNDTVSYAEIYDDVKEEIMKPSKLLEHAAYRVILRLKQKYRPINRVEIKLSKRNPPIGGQADYASVVLID